MSNIPLIGRAYLFDNCVNVTVGPAEDRRLITGLHSVCDINCKRCKSLIGWTYAKAYEQSQKYKEGKFIIEKINLFMEDSESFGYQVDFPAGERRHGWKTTSKSWGSSKDLDATKAVAASALASLSNDSSPRSTERPLQCPLQHEQGSYEDMSKVSSNRTELIYEYDNSTPVELKNKLKQGKRCWRKLSWEQCKGQDPNLTPMKL